MLWKTLHEIIGYQDGLSKGQKTPRNKQNTKNPHEQTKNKTAGNFPGSCYYLAGRQSELRS